LKRLAAASSFRTSLLSAQGCLELYFNINSTSRLPIQPPGGSEALDKDTVNMAYFFSTPVDIDIVLDDGDDRQMVDMKTEKGRREKAPLYKDGESVKGAVTIRPKDGKRLEHTGIKVKFVGTIGMFQCIISTYINSPMAQRCSSIEETTTNSSLWVKS
jgi:hypothetical protein